MEAVEEEKKVSHAITAWNLKTIFKEDKKKHKPFLLNGGNVVVVEVVDVDTDVVGDGCVGGEPIILATLIFVGLTCMFT